MNTASRFLKLLFNNTIVAKAGNNAALAIWGQLLDIPYDSQEGRLEIRIRLTELVSQIKRLDEETEKYSKNPQLHLAQLRKLKAGFLSWTDEISWESLRDKYFTESVLISLTSLEELLPDEQPIDLDEIKKFLDLLNDLIMEIHQSNLPSDLKQWLLKLLSQAMKSIHEYDFQGAKAFYDALHVIAGELAITAKDISACQTPENTSIREKLFAFVQNLQKLAAPYQATKQFAIDGYLAATAIGLPDLVVNVAEDLTK